MVPFMTTLGTLQVMTTGRMVMHHAAPAPLPPKIEGPDGEENATRDPGEKPPHPLVELEAEPRNHEAEEAGQGHVPQSGKGRDHQRLAPAPTARPRHQHERQPVRRDRRMEKRHREAGGGNGREDGEIHAAEGTEKAERRALSTPNHSRVVKRHLIIVLVLCIVLVLSFPVLAPESGND